MSRSRYRTLVLAALLRGGALVLALLVMVGAATPTDAGVGLEPAPVAAELALDEPPALAPAPPPAAPTRSPTVLAPPAPATAWSSRAAPPPIVPPPER